MTLRCAIAGLALAAASAGADERDACKPVAVETRSIAGVRLEHVRGEPRTVEFTAGMAIDADGTPRAYHPDDIGRDALAHAGVPGNWWALATDDTTPSGTPLVQGPGDPAPGHYVSTTSLFDASKPYADPRRYVDAESIPYIALPRSLAAAFGCSLGDLAWVERTALDGAVRGSAAIFADVSPETAPLGEGSIALARRLGVPDDPRHGGTFRASVRYALFCGSVLCTEPSWPRSVESIDEAGARLEALRRERDASRCPRP